MTMIPPNEAAQAVKGLAERLYALSGSCMTEERFTRAIYDSLVKYAEEQRRATLMQAAAICQLHVLASHAGAAIRALSPPPVGEVKGETMSDLRLNGKCTDHIWLMEDGEAPHTIGVRMDCGDSGTVYLTPKQALDLGNQLLKFAAPVGGSEK